MTKLTVIIPVYRVETTLDRCVESVLAQEWPDMEVILVDDGSPDGCPALCDQWTTRDGRVKVIHKENGGLSDARNAALDIATGELVTFVDSDDWLARDTYKSMVEEMTDDVDIVEFPVYCHFGSARQSMLSFKPHTYSDKHDYWLRCKAYTHTYAWNKVYRRRLFNEVRFPKGVVFEDAYTLPLLLNKGCRIKVTDKGLYYYCDNPSGITATASGEAWTSLLHSHLDNWNVTEDEEYYLHVLNIQLMVCRLTGVRPLLPMRRISSRKSLPVNMRIKTWLLNLLGIRGLCFLYRLFSYLFSP